MSETPGLIFLEDMNHKKKQPGFFRLYGKLLLLLFFALAVPAALFLITRGALSYRVSGAQYKRLRQAHVRIVEGAYETDPGVKAAETDTVSYPGRPEGAVLDVDFAALLAENPDTAAWLHIPALEVSYPVVYANDREYYTKHTFEGTVNANGAIFIEPFNRPSFADRNTFLYGHNSADGSMFGRLHELSFSGAGEEQVPFVFIYLKDGEIRKYRIYSFYVTKEDGRSFRTIGEDEYDTYVKETLRAAEKVPVADFSNRPDLLTLSTCYGATGTNERYLVHAVRVP